MVSVVHRINAAFGVLPKFVPYEWSASEIFDSNSPDKDVFNDGISLMFYHNAQQRRCVAVLKATVKTSIVADRACYLANLPNNRYIPKGGVRTYSITSAYSAALVKNSANLVVALSCHSGTIPANTTIDMQLEWTYI